jgi:hypothetical protein
MTVDQQYEVLYVISSVSGVLRHTRSSGLKHYTREDAQAEVNRLITAEPRLFSASIITTIIQTEKQDVYLRNGD